VSYTPAPKEGVVSPELAKLVVEVVGLGLMTVLLVVLRLFL
jgi:hypothetical protein